MSTTAASSAPNAAECLSPALLGAELSVALLLLLFAAAPRRKGADRSGQPSPGESSPGKRTSSAMLWIVAGLLLQVLARVTGSIAASSIDGSSSLAWILFAGQLIGIAVVVVGLANYAKSKGRHPAWSLLGLLSCVGVVVVALLKDRLDEAGAVAG